MVTRRLSADERRRQILRSAISVFASDTYHGATTKRIADEAGITEALIYRYFGSKRKLFTEAIVHTTGRMVEGLREILAEHREDPLKAISECFLYYAELLERHQEFARMIFLVLSELDDEEVRAAYLPHQEEALKLLGEAMEDWRARGYLRDESMNIKTATWLYYGTYLVLALVKMSHGGLALDAQYAIELAKPYFKPEIFDGT